MRAIVMVYGVVSYLLFFGVFLYLIAFVGGILVPKTLTSEAGVHGPLALLINLGLIILWGVQHTVMARDWFKEAIAHIVPHHTERSTYVLASTLILVLLMYAWQPIDGIIWQVQNSLGVKILWSVFGIGWVLVLLSTFLTDHFDLFGLRQTWLHFVKKTYTSVNFTESLLYRWIRHPMMLGLLLAFWATPVMTAGHLVFSLGMTVYILMGIHFEEKGLAASIGADYTEYQKRTARIIPKIY
jgi:methanethiol S-methyltransferase